MTRTLESVNPETVPVLQRPAACIAEVRLWIANKDDMPPRQVLIQWNDMHKWGSAVLLSALVDVLEGRG